MELALNVEVIGSSKHSQSDVSLEMEIGTHP
jgi:hypothetical protein